VFGAELAFDVWVDSAEILCYLESIHYNYCTTNKLSYNCMNNYSPIIHLYSYYISLTVVMIGQLMAILYKIITFR
jgi:hypothetical protein